jgi:signal transduction histidine kinase
VFRWRDGRFARAIPAITNLTDEATRVIFRDHQNRLWLGLQSGLVCWDTREKWLHGTTVRAIVEDRDRNLWVGTTNGLYRRTQDQFTHYTVADGLSQNRVSCLRKGVSGELWIGTETGGLNRLKEGRFTVYRKEQGLVSNMIGDLLEDDDGWLWVSSVRGIARVRKSDFDRLDAGQLDALRCIAYGKEDGLATVQCNDFAKPASWKDRDGRLWFATIKGLAVIDPRSAGNLNHRRPTVLIEELVADKKILYAPFVGEHVPAPVNITPGGGDMEIRYAGLSLQLPERVRFRYKLEGRDKDWVDAQNRRQVFYSNLQPGRYRFAVTACNNDGLWNEEGAELAFVVLPFFWQAWWFKAIILAALTLAGFGVYRFRAARFRHIEQLRVRIAADLHDEIGSNVASIALLSKLGQRTGTPESKVPELAEISRIAQQTAHNIREIVWFINPDHDTLPEMITRMREVARTLLSGLEHHFEAPAEAETVRLSLEFRRDMFLVFKEALHNIVKHARASRVDIEISQARGRFHLRVQDNGVGFEEKNSAAGNGLKNLRLRMARLGGQVAVKSEPGRGTTVTLSAKISRLHEGREAYLP